MKNRFEFSSLLPNTESSGDSFGPAIYAATAALSCLVVAFILLPTGSISQLAFAACAVLILVFRVWAVAAMLLVVQTALFLFEPTVLSEIAPSMSSMLFASTVLIALITCCRYLVLTTSIAAYHETLFKSLRGFVIRATAGRSNPQTAGLRPRNAATVTISEFIGGLFPIVAALIIAWWILASIQPIGNVPLQPTESRTITIAVLLLILFYATRSLLGVVTLRRRSPAEARMLLRSELLGWCRREVSAIVFRQQNHRRKRRR